MSTNQTGRPRTVLEPTVEYVSQDSSTVVYRVNGKLTLVSSTCHRGHDLLVDGARYWHRRPNSDAWSSQCTQCRRGCKG